jgi:hypothetical protein
MYLTSSTFYHKPISFLKKFTKLSHLGFLDKKTDQSNFIFD